MWKRVPIAAAPPPKPEPRPEPPPAARKPPVQIDAPKPAARSGRVRARLEAGRDRAEARRAPKAAAPQVSIDAVNVPAERAARSCPCARGELAAGRARGGEDHGAQGTPNMQPVVPAAAAHRPPTADSAARRLTRATTSPTPVAPHRHEARRRRRGARDAGSLDGVRARSRRGGYGRTRHYDRPGVEAPRAQAASQRAEREAARRAARVTRGVSRPIGSRTISSRRCSQPFGIVRSVRVPRGTTASSRPRI